MKLFWKFGMESLRSGSRVGSDASLARIVSPKMDLPDLERLQFIRRSKKVVLPERRHVRYFQVAPETPPRALQVDLGKPFGHGAKARLARDRGTKRLLVVRKAARRFETSLTANPKNSLNHLFSGPGSTSEKCLRLDSSICQKQAS